MSGVCHPGVSYRKFTFANSEGARETALVASASWLFVLASGKDQNNS